MPVAMEKRPPGVYLEEVTITPPPALETGVPVFLGRLAPAERFSAKERETSPLSELLRGDRAVSIDSRVWAALDAAFKASWAQDLLGFAVRGFFENGGRRCYVMPVGAGNTALADALEKIRALEDYDVLCAPDFAGEASAHVALLHFCASRPGCFALLDTAGSRYGTAFDAALLKPADLVSSSPARINGALYGPWIRVRGACPDCNGEGCSACRGTGQGFVPPSGHIAGVLARLDHRVGVHRAPANEPIEGALDVHLALGGAALSSLGAAGLNAIVALPGRGIRPWGARTLSPTDADFSHVGMRRTYLTVARWLELLAAELAFEPNDFGLWLRINREVTSFLDGLYRAGALYGETAEEAYYVKCDAETNPPVIRDAGEVVAEVGLTLARPSEFVVLRLVTFAGSARAESG